MRLGIEIGGTKLQLGLAQRGGEPIEKMIRCSIRAENGAQGILEQIRQSVIELSANYTIDQVGIGFGGPVDAVKGRTIKSHQIYGWDDFPLADWFQKELSIDAVLGNDCDVAGLAEARFGAGRESRVVLFVTIGTGIGGGLIIDQRVHRGAGCAATEIGHLRPSLDATDPEATVESLASGSGIENTMRERLAGDPKAADVEVILAICDGNPQRLSTKQIAACAIGGNRLAAEVIDGAARVLGWAIAQAITLVAPQVVVIGGGVSLIEEDFFLKPVRKYTRQYGFSPLAESYQILPARFGEEVVVYGAIALTDR